MVDVMLHGRKKGMSYDSIALWCMSQTSLPCKRKFTTRDIVKWAIRAKRAGYPKVTNYKEFHRMVKSGEITLSPA